MVVQQPPPAVPVVARIFEWRDTFRAALIVLGNPSLPSQRGHVIHTDCHCLSVAAVTSDPLCAATAIHYEKGNPDDIDWEGLDLFAFRTAAAIEEVKEACVASTIPTDGVVVPETARYSLATRAIAINYRLSGMRWSEVAEKVHVHIRTLRRWMTDWKKERKFEHRTHAGRPTRFTEEDDRILQDAMRDDPSISNTALCALISNKVSPQMISIRLRKIGIKRAPRPPCTELKIKKRIQTFMDTMQEIPVERRVYFDELKITLKVNGIHCTCFVYTAVRIYGFLYPPVLVPDHILSPADFLIHLQTMLLPAMQTTDVLLWDKSEQRGTTPSSQIYHCDPDAHRQLIKKGIQFVFLPPQQRNFTPLTLLASFIARRMQKSVDEIEKRSLSPVLPDVLSTVIGEVSEEQMIGYFKHRANKINV